MPLYNHLVRECESYTTYNYFMDEYLNMGHMEREREYGNWY